jgi:hypothetical protein
MRILIANNKFKGSLPALEMKMALTGDWVSTPTQDAQGKPISAHFGWVPGTNTAVMEMSSASGFALVREIELNLLVASILDF